jgi:hypothetical protein
MSGALVQILEAGFASDPATLKVDRAAGIIRNVRVLGLKSAHGREYTPEAVRNAIPLYEGTDVYLNHDYRTEAEKRSRPRPMEEKIGWLQEANQVADGGAVANLHLLPSHPRTGSILDAAEHHPAGFALSHDAQGRERREKGRVLIEGIAQVNSVDIVTRGATTRTLFEGIGMAGTTTTLKALREALPADSRGRKFLQLLEDAGMMAADAPIAAPDAPADPEEALKSGFKMTIMAILDDDSLDLAARKKKIGELLTMLDKATGGGAAEETPAATEGKGTPAPASEVKALQESFALKLKARDKCSAANIIPGRVLLKALDACTSEAEIDSLLQEAKGQQAPAGGGPRSRERAPTTMVPVKEGAGQQQGTKVEDVGSFVKRLRGGR